MQPSLAGRIRNRLIGAHQRSGRVLIDFLLMPTEIHAIAQIRSDDAVGGVARAFGNVLSRWVREAQPVRSPVLAGPFRALPIESVEALRHELRMLAWRPVLQKLCATPTHHPNGGLRVALGLTPSKGFDTRPMLSHFGQPVPAARAALRQWIAKRPSDEDWRAWELVRGLELATGGVGPQPTMAKAVEGAAAALIAAGGSYDIGGALVLLEAWVAARIHPSGPLELRAGSSALAARGRALVACLAVTHGLCSAASVARHFERAKATLSEQMAACRSRSADRIIIATPLRRILEESASLRGMGGGTHRSGSASITKGDVGACAPERGAAHLMDGNQCVDGLASIHSSMSF
ncbi:hypothetical protein [Pelomonas sp. Root1444]|uniref:hypothetical protein n=1 Tax=Pelomonas sp. Root1444 TaxID=1736464 RepID=UPI00191095F9|nr:hypothetical protein [Pelomonas sp. Root1444]